MPKVQLKVHRNQNHHSNASKHLHPQRALHYNSFSTSTVLPIAEITAEVTAFGLKKSDLQSPSGYNMNINSVAAFSVFVSNSQIKATILHLKRRKFLMLFVCLTRVVPSSKPNSVKIGALLRCRLANEIRLLLRKRFRFR